MAESNLIGPSKRDLEDTDIRRLVADIVIAYVAGNETPAA
jgi:hypothetical protein